MTDLEPERGDPYLRLHAVRVFVRDQERSLRFYLDKLGFTLAFDAQLAPGQRWVAVAPPDGGAVLSLVAPARSSPEHKLIGRTTQIVFVTEDVPAKFREWRARGVKFSSTPRLRRIRYDRAAAGESGAVWGGAFVRFKDLDGNSFHLVSFDAESRAVETQRRVVAERLEFDRRAARELDLARQVQSRLFPQTMPHAATLEYAGLCIPALTVGGDYYDFLNLGRGRLGLVIGDIAGKGMGAALLMANLQANLRGQCAIALEEPARFLCSVNQLFRESTVESAYATLLFAEYDDRTQVLRYANCGHLHGLLLRKDGVVDRLETTASVLGLFEEWECAIGEHALLPGDLLALYTDGVTESFGPGDEEFGETRLVDALRGCGGKTPPDVLASVVDALRKWSPNDQHDDITLIVARCRAC